MSSTPPSGGRLFVEPLEARVAPTGLVGQANNLAFKNGNPNYLDYNTAPVAAAPGQPGHLGFVSASSLGVNAPGVYALRLSGDGNPADADQVFIYNQQDGFGPNSLFLQATSSNVIAFFQDKNGDGQVQVNELVGLSLGKKVDLTVRGSVNGDIVTNLSQAGTVTLTSLGNANSKINSLSITGNVTGSILSGGDINNVTITGSIQNILAGTAANNHSYSFSGTDGIVTGTIGGLATYKDGHLGASITGTQIVSLTPGGVIQAGDGGLGASGGIVNTVRVLGDTDRFTIQGGAGGVGTATVKGGFGGDVENVLVVGVANSQINHLITIQGGAGGANPDFKGGNGGAVSGVMTGFNVNGSISADLLQQDILLRGGSGGDGFKAGNGGDVLTSNIRGFIPDDGSTNAEIQVIGGSGGTNINSGLKGGNGGNLDTITASNIDTLPDALGSTILLQGGTAGVAKNGGSVNGANLLGKNLVINAADGGAGFNKGGNGGSLTNLTINTAPNLFTGQLILNAGAGGDTQNGNAGSGGSIQTVRLLNSDLSLLAINTGGHGNGGTSEQGLGGNGGSVTDVILNDSGASNFVAGTAVHSGAGGNGLTGGGAAGDLSAFTFAGTNFNTVLTAGNGGGVFSNGSGSAGRGGSMLSVNVTNFPELSTVTAPTGDVATNLAVQTVTVIAGNGGNGLVDGGDGGRLDTVNVAAGGSIVLRGGTGGNGGSGVAGLGGGSNLGGSNSLVGTVSLTAGDGGQSGATPGDGGSIKGFVTSAASDIIIHAGNGFAGGSGGSITDSGTSLNVLTNLPNSGSLSVVAGKGDAINKTGGLGGDISGFHGYIGENGLTTFTAGNGGGSAAAKKVGAGGSVSDIELSGISGATVQPTRQQVTIDAGNAGTSQANNKGADGGSIARITLTNLDPNTAVQHIAAGDASSGKNKGGAGGSITTVHVGAPGDATADIGIRSGFRFGYETAGGLFVGVGGTGGIASGLNGNVTDITARAISSIVAGKGSHPSLVNAIDRVTLLGSNQTDAPRANANGSFLNFGTAALVGSVVNPTAAGASTFKYDANGPIDGLIACLTIPTNTNFQPEAIVTTNPENPNQLELGDIQEPNSNPLTISPAPVTILA